jgi:antitoxin (DNA-binding transcriptional repressor) of toxin-antitoxin stability system
VTEVAIRDLRNHGGEILDRVAGGEAMTVTRDGHAIAELRPPPRRPLQAAVLLQRRRSLPVVDAAKLRADIDDLLDPTL